VTAPRTLASVAGDLERLVIAGAPAGPSRDRAAARARELAAEAHRLGRQEASLESRKSLARAWSAWLGLMMSVKLPGAGGKSLLEDVLDLEPGLREQFAAFLEGGGRA
jgi:site-specific recombinase XerC